MHTIAVEFQGVSKIYRTGWLRRRSLCALADVNLRVPRGSVFGVVGPNRAGKTTLLKLLLSLCRPTRGLIMRLGSRASNRATLARVGYVHEHQAFPLYLAPYELLRYYGALSLVSSRDLAERIPRLLDDVGLADRAHDSISTFSKGMVQRLALAQALINEPELLVLDEPTEGMDLLARNMLHEIIRRHQKRRGTTLLVSHSMPDVQELCDQLVVLREGRAVFSGAAVDLAVDHGGDRAKRFQDALEPLFAGSST